MFFAPRKTLRGANAFYARERAEFFGRKAPRAEEIPHADNVRLRRAVASHVLRRGGSEIAAADSFDSARD